MMRLVKLVGVAAVGVLIAASHVRAGVTEGDVLVMQFQDASVQSLADFEEDVDAMTASCISKLAALDARGADQARLEAFAEQCQAKLLGHGFKAGIKLRKLAGKTVGRLGNLFEDELVDQVTAIVAASEAWSDGANVAFLDAVDAIDTALAAEIAD